MRSLSRWIVAIVSIALIGSAFGSFSQASARNYVPGFGEVKRDKGPVFRDGCLIYTQAVTSPPCRYGQVGSEKKVTVLGDSHALQWTPTLIEIANERGWELTMLLKANCTAALVNISASCNRWRLNALKRIREEKPRLVFVASNTAENTYVMRGKKRLNRTASERVFRKGLGKTLLNLRKAGSEVTVMRDLPMSREFLPPLCVQQNRSRPARCTFRAYRPLAHSYDFVAAKRFKQVQIIDPLPKVCPRQKCHAVEGNILKYRDRGHISATYALTLVDWLSGKLQNPFKG